MWHCHPRRHFTVKVKQVHPKRRHFWSRHMANGIIDGGSGTFAAELDLNGSAVGTQPTFTFTTNVADATVTPDASGQSAVISVPAGETATSITVTATTTDPNGNSVSGFLTVPLSAPAVFSVTVTQTA